MMTSWCHFTVQLHILDDRASMTEIHLFAKKNVGASSYLTGYQNEENFDEYAGTKRPRDS